MIALTHEDRLKLTKRMQARQRWQRALARWLMLDFWSKVYALAGHLQDEAIEAATLLDGETAFKMARLAIEREVKDGQQRLPL